MKKPLLVLALLSAGIFSAHAQSNKVVSAKMHLDEYVKDGDTTALKDAKDAIDLAASNDKTKDDPKMYLYRGNVYRTIYERQISILTSKGVKAAGKMDKTSMMKATGIAYVTTDTTNISVAAHCYMMVIQLVPKDFYADEARQGLAACMAHLANKATSDYAAGNLAQSLAFFEKILAIYKFQGISDTTRAYKENVENAALVAEKSKNYPKAIKYYKETIRLKIGGPEPYNGIINDYYATGDTADAVATLKDARAAFPDDVNLLISETNIYLSAHDNDKAISNLQMAINKLSAQKDDSHKILLSNLYFVLGNTYDRLANPTSTDKNAVAPKPANYDDMYAKAEDNYNKALALTPENFDELFDLGALYNNRAVGYNQAANDVPPSQTKKYNDLVAQANEYSKKAQPILEKAHSIKPDDEATKAALLKIYASTGQTDKIKELQGVK